MSSEPGQYVDPAVSRAKFEREIAEYRSFEADYRARGWFLVKAGLAGCSRCPRLEEDQPARQS